MADKLLFNNFSSWRNGVQNSSLWLNWIYNTNWIGKRQIVSFVGIIWEGRDQIVAPVELWVAEVVGSLIAIGGIFNRTPHPWPLKWHKYRILIGNRFLTFKWTAIFKSIWIGSLYLKRIQVVVQLSFLRSWWKLFLPAYVYPQDSFKLGPYSIFVH